MGRAANAISPGMYGARAVPETILCTTTLERCTATTVHHTGSLGPNREALMVKDAVIAARSKSAHINVVRSFGTI